MSAKKSLSFNQTGIAFITISSPSRKLRLTFEPGSTPTSSASARGIRTPRLFPHFWIRVCMAQSRLKALPTTPEIITTGLLRIEDATLCLPHKHPESRHLKPTSTCKPFSLRPDGVHLFTFDSLNSKKPTISSDSL
jgi:hypothetical protein